MIVLLLPVSKTLAVAINYKCFSNIIDVNHGTNLTINPGKRVLDFVSYVHLTKTKFLINQKESFFLNCQRYEHNLY